MRSYTDYWQDQGILPIQYSGKVSIKNHHPVVRLLIRNSKCCAVMVYLTDDCQEFIDSVCKSLQVSGSNQQNSYELAVVPWFIFGDIDIQTIQASSGPNIIELQTAQYYTKHSEAKQALWHALQPLWPELS